MNTISIGIIGAGLIGKKRALSLPQGATLKIVCDIDKERAHDMAKTFHCAATTDWHVVVADPEIQAVFICTSNNLLAPFARDAIQMRKHVFMEKPGGINVQDLKSLIEVHKKFPCVVMIGYNHRYHPAIQKAKEIIESGIYGPVLFIRARYGHGGRLGYEKEWRFNKTFSGGGELMDQGSHLIDLINYFAGPMDTIKSIIGTRFWNTKLEDTAFVLMKNRDGVMAEFSVSCVEWKNIFSFEIMLQRAKIDITGLGRSYGEEALHLYTMKPEMGVPDFMIEEFPEEDMSWKVENSIFLERIKKKNYSDTALKDALYVQSVIAQIYKENSQPNG